MAGLCHETGLPKGPGYHHSTLSYTQVLLMDTTRGSSGPQDNLIYYPLLLTQPSSAYGKRSQGEVGESKA